MTSQTHGAWDPVPAPRMPRLVGAIVVAVVLHTTLLLRLDAYGGNQSTASASVMAVRILRAASVESPTPAAKLTTSPAPTSVSTDPEPAPSEAPERKLLSTPKPQTRAAADEKSSRPDLNAPAQSPRSGALAAASASSALSSASDYAVGAQLDPGPRPLGDIDPDYPDTVRLRSGTVVLRLLISDSGNVDEVGVVRAEPQGVFEQAAIDAFSNARFSPGMIGGRPVKSQIRIEVEFMPINRGARISGRSY